MPPSKPKRKDAGVLVPTARDGAYLKALQRHHLLDTGQLFKVTGGNYVAHQRRLTKLATTPDNLGRIYIEVVEIPSVRMALMNVYRLTAAGYQRLVEIRAIDRYTWRKGDPMIHRYATGSLTLSFELGCAKRNNLEYISPEQYFRDEKRCPHARRDEVLTRNPLAITTSEGDLIPDDMVGIRYVAEGKARFLLPEIDRRTETVNPRIHKDSTIAKKVRQYVEIIRTEKYRDYWGVPNIFPLFYTISEEHADYLREHVREHVHDPKIARMFLFGFNTRFGKDWGTTPVGYETISPPGKRPFLVAREIFVEDVLGSPFKTIDGVLDLTFA